MELWERFADLFQGFSRAYGQYTKPKPTERGKAEGRASTVASPTTIRQWQSHLIGDTGLGVIALRDDDTVAFAAIDIDVYNLNHVQLEEKIKKLNLPLVICRSKSGGAHCYLFLSIPLPADDIRKMLDSWAAALGFGGVEVFPKQSYRATPQDIGNWINLPYFEAEKTMRYAIKDGQALSLIEFLDYAEASKADATRLETVKLISGEVEIIWYKDGPICLQHYEALGAFPEGMRNDSMLRTGVFLKKAFADEWQNKLPLYNAKFCDPPLPLSEINTIIKSLSRKDYDVKCGGPYCDKKKCKAAKYGCGITANGANRPEIGGITKYDGDPVIWAIEVDGKRLTCSTDTLLSQSAFNSLCMEKINRVPGSMPKHRWEQQLDELMANVDVVPVPEDASMKGQFMVLLETYCTQTNRQAKVMDEVRQGKPYRHEGKIYFQSNYLFEFLAEKRFKLESFHQAWQWLREVGGDKKFVKIKGKGCNVWIIPEFDVGNEELQKEPVFNKETF